MGIIRSILDSDLYKFSMQYAVLRKYPNIPVTYRFTDRKPQGKFTEDFHRKLRREIELMSKLALTDAEAEFLQRRCPFLPKQYIEYLRNYRFDPSEVITSVNDKGELTMEIVGLWERTILWEVPLMALISELRFQDEPCDIEAYAKNLHRKGRLLAGTIFTDFGTRRRRSWEIQNEVVSVLRNYDGFVGTSNVYLAFLHDVKPIGTVAHEWTMAVSALEGLRHANRHAMRIWSEVYQGALGIALTDTFGTDAFWEDFDPVLSRLFDGVRHDSDDPFLFAERAIKHYQDLGIDPRHKTVVFSDGLNCELARKLWDAFLGKIKVSFGIGTHLTNDVFGCAALNMVIKLYTCNGIPVIKMGDGNGKGTGDKDAMAVALWTFKGKPLGI